MDTKQEQDWVAQAQRGEAESFGHLVHRYGGMVMAMTYSRIGNHAVSQDISQDVFLAAFENLPKLRSAARFPAWLKAITVNVCRQWRRSQAYRRRLEQDCTAVRERLGLSEQVRPDELLEQTESRAWLDEALGRLNTPDQEALVLFYYEGQSIHDAAARLGIEENAFKKRLQRARTRLRDSLSDLLEADLTRRAKSRDGLVRGIALALPLGSSFRKAIGVGVVPRLWRFRTRRSVFAIAASATAAIGIVFFAVHFMLPAWPPASKAVERVAPSAAEATDKTAAVAPIVATPQAQQQALAAAAATVTGNAASGGPAESQSAPVAPYLKGIVRDAAGAPVAGAHVEVHRAKVWREQFSRSPQVIGSTTTRPDGSFVVDKLPSARELRLLICHPAYADDVELVTMEKESVKEAEFVLDPPVQLSGQVVDDSSHPVPDAEIAVWNIIPARLLASTPKQTSRVCKGMDFGPVVTAKSDSSGRFIFPNMSAGCIVRRVSAHKDGCGFAFSRGEPPPPAWSASGCDKMYGWWGSSFVVSDKGMLLKLETQCVISGRVLDRSNGDPLAGVCIGANRYLELPGSTFPERFRDSTTSGSDGSYRLVTYAKGWVKLIAIREGGISEVYNCKLDGQTAIEHFDFHVGPGAVVEGVVRDAQTGQPLPRARLTFIEESILDDFAGGASSDDLGHYRIDGLHDGQWRIRVGTGWKLDPEHNPGLQNGELPLTLIADSRTTRDVYLTPLPPAAPQRRGPEVLVTVTDPSGKTVSGAKVIVNSLNVRQDSDTQGHATLRLREPGTINIVAHSPDHIGKATLVVNEGKNALDLVLNEPSGKMSGRVTTPDGKPLGRAVSVLLSARAGDGWKVDVRPDGTFVSPALPVGAFFVYPQDPDNRLLAEPTSLNAEIQDGETTSGIDFTMTPMTQRVAGVVQDKSGKPLPGRWVSLHGWNVERNMSSDGKGRFAFENVAGERLKLEVGIHGAPGTVGLLVAAGAEDVKVVIDTGGTVRGNVLLTDEQTAKLAEPPGTASLMVTAKRRDVEAPDVQFKVAPRAELTLPPGTYDLRFEYVTKDSAVLCRFADVRIESGKVTDLGDVALVSERGAP